MRILITNNTLAQRAGTELYVRDLALALRSRGHEPVAFSPLLGKVAEELSQSGIKVVDDLKLLGTKPDIIHGHHHMETMMALLYFADVPAIYFCHGFLPWEEAPLKFPRVMRYVAVDKACYDRLVCEGGVSPERVDLLLNFVDLGRFRERQPLPAKPRRALIFSNTIKNPEHLDTIQAALAEHGIECDAIGRASGNTCTQPETILPNYDIVFAIARSALEALAVGTSVVLCDAQGLGPMVTSANVDQLRPLNFGPRALTKTIEKDLVKEEIAGYNPEDAQRVAKKIRSNAGMDLVVDKLLYTYENVINEYTANNKLVDLTEECQATALYLQQWMPRLESQLPTVPKLKGLLNRLEVELRATQSKYSIRRYMAMAQYRAMDLVIHQLMRNSHVRSLARCLAPTVKTILDSSEIETGNGISRNKKSRNIPESLDQRG